jgi:transposase-like protein
MRELVTVGSFCSNENCLDYGKVDAGKMIRYGKSSEKRQRFQCKTCRKTFNERSGTRFYHRKTKEEAILECLALLAEGVRISRLSRAKGIKADTIWSFLREAAQHAEQIEAVLLNDYRIRQAQIDGRWTDGGRQQEKKTE